MNRCIERSHNLDPINFEEINDQMLSVDSFNQLSMFLININTEATPEEQLRKELLNFAGRTGQI